MIRLTDGIATVVIEMTHWDEYAEHYTPDWAGDFFDVRSLIVDLEEQAYVVNDVNWCINQAKDCLRHAGDYYDGFPGNPGDCLFVDGDLVLEITDEDDYIDYED